MSDGVKQRPPMALHHQGSDAPSAHCRPGYPLSGCVPAEPDSVSPGSVRLASAQQCGKPPSDTGVMPQKILLYRFPTEKRSRSYPHTLEKSHFLFSSHEVSPLEKSIYRNIRRTRIARQVRPPFRMQVARQRAANLTRSFSRKRLPFSLLGTERASENCSRLPICSCCRPVDSPRVYDPIV